MCVRHVQLVYNHLALELIILPEIQHFLCIYVMSDHYCQKCFLGCSHQLDIQKHSLNLESQCEIVSKKEKVVEELVANCVYAGKRRK